MTDLCLEQASAVVDAVHEYGANHGLSPLAVAVLDSGGHLIAFEREDGASFGRLEIAFGKAYGALALGAGSRALMNRAESQAYFVLAAAMAFQLPVIPVPGGVIVRDRSGRAIGAVGVSGDSSENDERAALSALATVGMVADPG